MRNDGVTKLIDYTKSYIGDSQHDNDLGLDLDIHIYANFSTLFQIKVLSLPFNF